MSLRQVVAAVAAASMFSGAAMADAGDFLVRLRGLGVVPNESASITPIGGSVDIDASIVPEIDFTYFFTDHIAVELIAAVTPHDVTATGTALGNVDLGDTWLLPPTVTLQYHFDTGTAFQPYVGVGVNYTTFFNADLPGGSPLVSIDYDDSFGLAGQVGFDYFVGENWFLNFDVKYIDINTDVTIDAGGLGIVNADVDIDPWVIGVGVGWRF